MVSRGGVYLAAGLLILFTVLIPLSGAAPATVLLSAGVEYQSRAGGGIITFTDDYYPTSISVADNFLYLAAPVTGFTNVGFDAPINANMSVTNISQWHIDYSTDQTLGAKVERVYVPGIGAPTVTGAGADSWNSGITSVTTSLNDNVVLTWPVPTGVNQGANIIISFMPLLIVLTVIGMAKAPEYWRIIVTTAIIAGVLLLVGQAFL